MRKINQTIKEHWVKFAVLVLTVAGTIVSQAGPALADRIASAITGDRITISKISSECISRDSMLMIGHNNDIDKLMLCINKLNESNIELIRKIDVQGAKMDGFIEAQRMMHYFGAENDSTKPCSSNFALNK